MDEDDDATDGDATRDASVDPWADRADDEWPDPGTDAADGDATAGEGEPDGAPPDRAGADRTAGRRGDESVDDATGPRRYRVLDRDDDALVFVDLDTPDPGPGPTPDEGFEPVRVAAAAAEYADDVAATVDDLEPGNVVTASLRWPDPGSGDDADGAGTPLARVESVTVDRESRYLFVDGVDPVFEAARETWRETRAAGEAMGSRVTRDTDGEPNGALYVFAETGARDLLGEFRSGTTPLEPLVDRVNDDLPDDDPRAVFVLRPADGGFVVVYIAFREDGLLARTVRDTYR